LLYTTIYLTIPTIGKEKEKEKNYMAIIEEIKMNKEDEICLITRILNKDTGKKMGSCSAGTPISRFRDDLDIKSYFLEGASSVIINYPDGTQLEYARLD